MDIDFGRDPSSALTMPRSGSSSGSVQRLTSFGAWKDFVRDHFPWLEHRHHGEGPFAAEVRIGHCAGASLSTIHAGASEVIRTRQLADAAETGSIKLLWQRSGSLEVEQDGRRCVLTGGEVAVCDTTRPYRILLAERTSFLVLMLDHQAIPGWQRLSSQVCGLRLVDCASTRGALGALTTLAGLSNESLFVEGDPVLRALRWMLGAALERSSSQADADDADDVRLARARRYIERNVGDPGLSADKLAAAMCMSRRSLYVLFGRQGLTPARVIKELRLERAFQELHGARRRQRHIIDVAFDLGFSDYATFSRLFKARFGVSPSVYRKQGTRS